MTPSDQTAAPLFITGTARAGTNLLARMLSMHPAVALAIDPYLPLLRSFRNAAIRAACTPAIAAKFTDAPFQDYYFTDERIAVMDAIQEADLTISFDESEQAQLVQAVKARARLESPDLEPLLSRLRGTTYKALFDSAFSIVAEARGAKDRAWVGIKEVWSIEFCAALARAYPRAKFIVIVRDPRAVVASMHKLAEKNETQRAHTLSYARHWRKCVAFCTHYESQPWSNGRFHVIRYEDLVSDPARAARVLCDFLGVELAPAMEQAEGFWDPARRSVWRGNSSYAEQLSGIDATLVERWRATIEPAALALIELACGPEMTLFGYPSKTVPSAPDPQVLKYLLRDAAMPASWRSDLQDVQQDYGFELFRMAAIGAQEISDESVVRRCFLYPEARDALQNVRAGRGPKTRAARQQ